MTSSIKAIDKALFKQLSVSAVKRSLITPTAFSNLNKSEEE
jgi:hypothetical protein